MTARPFGRAGWLVAAALLTLVVIQVVHAPVWGDDLRVFWSAGAQADRGADPWVRGFDYLPASLAVWAPLGLLPFAVVRLLFLGFGGLAIIVTAVAAARLFRLPTGPTVAVTLATFPAVSALEFANATLIEVPIVAAVVEAATRGRWRRVAVLLTVGLAVKPVIAPCLLALLLARQWRLLLGVAATTAAANAVALLVVGGAAGWLRQARFSLRVAGAEPASADLSTTMARLGLPGVATGALDLLVVAVAAGVLLRIRSELDGGMSRPPQAALVVCLPLLVFFLVGPVAWAHYPLLLLPLVVGLASSRSRVARVLTGLAVVALCSLEPLAGQLVGQVPPRRLFLSITIGLVLLVAAAGAGSDLASAAPPPPASRHEHDHTDEGQRQR